MFGKAIQGAEFRQGAQFVFRKRHTPFEIVQRLKCSILALPDELFSVFLTQSVYDTKSKTNSFTDPPRRFASASLRSSLVAIPT